jgi:hypothetical protein
VQTELTGLLEWARCKLSIAVVADMVERTHGMPKMAEAPRLPEFAVELRLKVIDLKVLTTTLPLLLRLAVEQNSPFSNATVTQFLF